MSNALSPAVRDALHSALGPENVLTGADAERYGTDWTGDYVATPLAVLRPANTAEVAEAMRIAAASGLKVVPVSGNTSLAGGTYAPGALMLSLERMNRIRAIRLDSRIAIVEAGVVLATLRQAAEAENLVFPVTFGAEGSAMIGGILSTHAGGSNVVRYGPLRAQCLGIEVVLASGEVLDLMSELHKDNTGYDLRDLFIGAEGTLGVITGAVLRLSPRPLAYATAMVALPDLDAALRLLGRLQAASSGSVEAFEYMPASYIDAHLKAYPKARPPFEARHAVNVFVEIGAGAAANATPGEDGALPVVTRLEEALAAGLEDGDVRDAVIARSEAERREMWARREVAGELALAGGKVVNCDVAVPLDKVGTFLDAGTAAMARLDPEGDVFVVSHLGDGNVHFTCRPSRDDAALRDRIWDAVEDIVQDLGGSFSAEHGIGKSKLASMARRKDPVALNVMGRIKQALDPDNMLNPGKLLP